MEKVNVICLKWGDRYPAFFVNRLYAGVRAHLHRPFRFVCVTDDPSGLADGIEAAPFPAPPEGWRRDWPHIYVKLLLFRDGLASLEGPTLFLDLDVVIVDDLDCFFDYRPGEFCIIHNWVERRKQLFRKPPPVGNSSMFRFEAGRSGAVYDEFFSDMERATDRKLFRTEQAFLTHAVRQRLGKVNWWPDEWVRSFKRHSQRIFPLNLFLQPKLPPRVKVLVFHGRPDPDEAIAGYRGKRIHQHTVPAPWIRDFWCRD